MKHTIKTEIFMSGDETVAVVTIRRSDNKKLTQEDIGDALEALEEDDSQLSDEEEEEDDRH